MIVKVQQQLAGNAKYRQMLVYNKNRSIMYQHNITNEVQEILGKRPKAYFEAKVVNKKVVLEKEVEAQDW